MRIKVVTMEIKPQPAKKVVKRKKGKQGKKLHDLERSRVLSEFFFYTPSSLII